MTRAREAELYVAELEGRLAGTVTFCPQGSPWSEVAQPGEGEFRMLGVHPSARRRGVAESLVSVCLERSRELGYDAVVLCSLPVQQPAHRIYERFGFRRIPDRDWSPAEGIDLQAFRGSTSAPRRARNRSRSTTTRVTSPRATSLSSPCAGRRPRSGPADRRRTRRWR